MKEKKQQQQQQRQQFESNTKVAHKYADYSTLLSYNLCMLKCELRRIWGFKKAKFPLSKTGKGTNNDQQQHQRKEEKKKIKSFISMQIIRVHVSFWLVKLFATMKNDHSDRGDYTNPDQNRLIFQCIAQFMSNGHRVFEHFESFEIMTNKVSHATACSIE